MKKLFFVLMMCIFLSGVNGITYAKSNDSPNLNLEYELITDNELKLQWEDLADNYTVYKDNEKVWQGEDTSHIIKNLEADYSYSFTVVAHKDEELYGISTAKFQTPSNDNLIQNFSHTDDEDTSDSLKNTNLNAVINNEEVILDLQGNLPDDNGVYELYKDDVYIGNLKTNKFIDTDLENGKTYFYKVVGKKEIDQSEKDEINKYMI